MDARPRRRIGELLVEAGVINEAQLQEALARRQATGRRLGAVLADMGLASEEQICRAVATQEGIEVVDLSAEMPDPQVLALIPADLAIKHCMVPLRMQGARLVLAMGDPLDTIGLDAAWRAARAPSVERVAAPESEVLSLIQEFYANSQAVQQTLKSLVPTEAVAILTDVNAARPTVIVSDFNATEALNAILGNAVATSATHVHIEPTGRSLNIRYRVDGRLRRVAVLPSSAHSDLIGRLRSLFQVDPNQHAISQEGKARLQLGQHQVALHLQIVPTLHGERATVRVLDAKRFQLRVRDLGFTPEETATVENVLSMPQGIVLVAGPEDAGVAETLYAFLNHLRDEGLNLITVESPIEATLSGITQIEVQARWGIQWADALRAAMKCDPDVIMLGELADREAAALALRAAMNGQLVIAGVRAESAAAAIALLMDMGLESFLLSSALRAVIGQRVVRNLCPDCRAADTPDARSLDRLDMTTADLEGKTLLRGTGCRRCAATGYAGRSRIFEVARVKAELRRAIATRAASTEIAAAAHQTGMRSLRDAALAKVFAGQTSLAEAAAVVPAIE